MQVVVKPFVEIIRDPARLEVSCVGHYQRPYGSPNRYTLFDDLEFCKLVCWRDMISLDLGVRFTS